MPCLSLDEEIVRLMTPHLPARLTLALAAALNLAPLAVTGLWLAPGPVAGGATWARMRFVARHMARWRFGWTLWMAGSLGLVLSIWVVARAMSHRVRGLSRDLLRLAIVAATIGGAADVAGDSVQVVALPDLASHAVSAAGDGTLAILFALSDHLAAVLSGGVANTLYAVAGILVTIALARATAFPGWITALGGVTWLVTLAATPAVFFPALAPVAVGVAIALYAGWLGAIALWGIGGTGARPPFHLWHRV